MLPAWRGTSPGTDVTMGRRTGAGRQLHGWLNLDKPVGISSLAAVQAVRRATGAAKAGHAGTLDPFASGVLPVALGEATKTQRCVQGAAKTYEFTVRWGERRTTDDPEGEILDTSAHRPGAPEIAAAVGEFTGEITQVPPVFSAVKVAGRRAYDLARAGEKVELAPRVVRVDSFALIDQPDDDHARFRVICGKGTYMRALARDLAQRLGTCGYLAALRRTRVGGFRSADAISLEKLTRLAHRAAADLPLVPIAAALDGIPAFAVTDEEARRLRSGQAVPMLRPEDRRRMQDLGADDVMLAIAASTPVALARVEGIQIKPVRVLNL